MRPSRAAWSGSVGPASCPEMEQACPVWPVVQRVHSLPLQMPLLFLQPGAVSHSQAPSLLLFSSTPFPKGSVKVEVSLGWQNRL